MTQPYDLLLIGAGHNGLTTAGFLAQAGKRVLVLERRNTPGGIAATEEIFPGVRANTGFPSAHLLHPDVIKGLRLEQYGLEFLDSPVSIFAPQKDGQSLIIGNDPATTAIAQISTHDAKKYPEFIAFVNRLAGVLAAMMPLTPPDLKGPYSMSELWPWAQVALKARGLGERDMMEFIRVLPMSSHDFLSEWFESDAVKGALGLFSTLNTFLGPMGAGTALGLLYQFTGKPGPVFVKGGAGMVSEALMKSAQAFGAEVRLGTAVREVLVEGGKVMGVVTTSGETISAKMVVSSADPRHTLFDLVGAYHIPVRVMRRARNVRYRGSTATVHFLLNGLPQFGQTSPDQLKGWLAFNPSLKYLEQAYDAAKYGRFSEKPALIAHLPTLHAGAAGQQVLSVMARYAPFKLKDGDWDSQKDALAQTVLNTLAEYAPALPGLVKGMHTLTPLDYEREYGLAEGHWMHGQMGLDQLLMLRPVPGWGKYRTPVEGLYLCGSGTHPGGGITGLPGMNAARELLKG
ncbi:MAG: NAD(P)/FAD-dependent oxidoreductase [Anaerolineales bacterium]|nr:NAD(P)/FAD-dependent oxidoreductase [Anaerolineales bacterium]